MTKITLICRDDDDDDDDDHDDNNEELITTCWLKFLNECLQGRKDY